MSLNNMQLPVPLEDIFYLSLQNLRMVINPVILEFVSQECRNLEDKALLEVTVAHLFLRGAGGKLSQLTLEELSHQILSRKRHL